MASVPVDERTKAMLGELRERIERETGHEVTQQQVVRRVVERQFVSQESLVNSFRTDSKNS